MKPLTYDALMMLGLEEIQALFPFGAAKLKGRWVPATEGAADFSLRKLLKDKRARSETPQWLRRTPPAHRDNRRDAVMPPTADQIREAAKQSAYTADPSDPMDAGEIVPANWQRQFSAEADERFKESHAEHDRRVAMRSRLARLRQLGIEHVKAGKDVDAALEAAWKQIQSEKAA